MLKSNKQDEKSEQKRQLRRKIMSECDTCANYTYDEEYEEYVCDVNMDEDDFVRFMTDKRETCPYYRNGDEYRVVRKQM